jgi:hypothetical protein
MTFSFLVATLYFMFSMQWNMDFYSLNNYYPLLGRYPMQKKKKKTQATV